jgi:hypothetical protein
MADETESKAKSSPVALLFAWLVVLVPLAWGVQQTVKKTLALFQ